MVPGGGGGAGEVELTCEKAAALVPADGRGGGGELLT